MTYVLDRCVPIHGRRTEIEVFLDMEDVMNGERERIDEFLVRDLRGKIKAKMDIAKTLGAFFAGLLAAVITFVSDSKELDRILAVPGMVLAGRDVPPGSFYKYIFLAEFKECNSRWLFGLCQDIVTATQTIT